MLVLEPHVQFLPNLWCCSQCPYCPQLSPSTTSTDARNNLLQLPLVKGRRFLAHFPSCSLSCLFFVVVEIRFSFLFFYSSLDSTHTLVLLLTVYLTPNAATGLRKYAVPGGKPVLPGRKRDSGAVKRKIYAFVYSDGMAIARHQRAAVLPPLHPSPPALAVGNASCLTNQPSLMQELML